MRVRLSETNLFGDYLYRLYVNDMKLDQFFSRTPLTWAEQKDIEDGYREGLDVYGMPKRLTDRG